MQTLARTAAQMDLDLIPEHLSAFEIYYQELVEWNQRVNLTSITDREEVQIKHFLDSLTCLLVMAGHPSRRVLDVGTGPGFPGVPLKIVRPEMQLTLLESVRKKTQFLIHLVRQLDLEHVEVVWGRAENIGHQAAHRECYDVVVARAVADLPVLVEYALPFCRLGGIFVAQKGVKASQEAARAQAALDILGGRLREIKALHLEGMDDPRHLLVIEKVDTTSDRYPRRPGIPDKRPLGQ